MKEKIKSSYNSWKTACLFLAPFMIFYTVFTLFPLVKGFVMSLYKGRFGCAQEFAGLSNYVYMLKDIYFWEALLNTCLFVAISTPLTVAFGLFFALISNSRIKGANFVKIAAFMPYVLSIAVVTSIWVYIFKPYTGILNNILIQLGIASEQIMWFDKPALAWATILIATLWWTVGFNTILFLAGLQEIPDSLYEASALDGAGKIQQFLYITLPSLKNITLMVILLQIIASFKLFGQPWLMTGGGPGRSTRPLVQYIYQIGFSNWDFGYASAISYVLLLIMVVISLVFHKLFVEKEVGQ
ncbi:sugar ABC transporter permease [Oscillospiraceae bacterium PP1C4]